MGGWVWAPVHCTLPWAYNDVKTTLDDNDGDDGVVVMVVMVMMVVMMVFMVITHVCRSEVCVWDLQSILIKPAQRVLKYPLLLSQLLKHTGSCHPDYRDIHTAHMAVGKMAQDINEIKRRKDLGKIWRGEGRSLIHLTLGA